MKYRIPVYYNQFVCLGAECRDTCCKGWKIGIDEERYRAYGQVAGKFGHRLFREIDHKDRCFRLKGRACAFLNQEGFCDIYKELGRDGLCKGCRIYPRHMEDYGQLREVMLSLSCPEAARLILEDRSAGAWREQCLPKPGQEGQDLKKAVPDEGFLLDLQNLRQAMVCLVKKRTVNWGQRLAMVLALAHDFQVHLEKIQKLNYPGSEERRRRWVRWLSLRYLAQDAPARFRKRLEPYQHREVERMIRMGAWMRLMEKTEPVLAGWGQKQAKVCSSLYHKRGIGDYLELERRFRQETMGWGQEWENLALYFIHTYILGAVYDGAVYTAAKQVVFSCQVIREWCLFRYGAMGKITKEGLVAASYRYSRQVENSDANLDYLERQLEKNPLFGLPSMMVVLAQAGGPGEISEYGGKRT